MIFEHNYAQAIFALYYAWFDLDPRKNQARLKQVRIFAITMVLAINVVFVIVLLVSQGYKGLYIAFCLLKNPRLLDDVIRDHKVTLINAMG